MTLRPTPSADFTALIDRWQGGDEESFDRLFSLLYGELKLLAGKQLRREKGGHTLQPTAVVHEAYVKLLGRDSGRVESRLHFLALAAKAMRQILVDHARRKQADKRGGAWRRLTLTDALGEPIAIHGPSVDTLALDRSLDRLAEIHSRAAQVVELRYFGGLTIEQVGETLGIAPKTVVRDWRTARLWLFDQLSDQRTDRPSDRSGDAEGIED